MKLTLFITFIFIFFSSTGCAFKAKPLHPSEYSQYPLLYEVQFDLKCESVIFTKSDRFVPYKVEGKTLSGTGIKATLPKNTLALFIDQRLDHKWYALIYPNGEFISDEYSIVHATDLQSSKFLNGATCSSINNKLLFKPINTSELK